MKRMKITLGVGLASRRLRAIGLGLALLALLPLSASTQPAYATKSATLMLAYDLDGEAADDNQIIAATALVDNGTSVAGANWTILAQPDTCRLLDTTIVDTNLTAGSITVTGIGCLGESRICSFSFGAADNTGVQSLTCTDSEGAYFSSVTTVTTDTMTGESDETFALGYTSDSVIGWGMYGTPRPTGPNGEHGIDPWGSIEVGKKITTAGLEGTTIVGVTAADDPFANVSLGDLLIIQVQGIVYERKVTNRIDADSVVVNQLVTIPSAGATFRYRKFYFSTNPADEMAIPVEGWSTIMWFWSIDANADTGGVISTLECTVRGAEWPNNQWQLLDDGVFRLLGVVTTASGAAQADVSESIDLRLLPYTHCRMGFHFGTNDDGDGADEDINVQVVLMK